MISLNDDLYYIGGAGTQTYDYKNIISSAAVDIWDIKHKDWNLLGELQLPRHGHSICYLGTQIFIVGALYSTI